MAVLLDRVAHRVFWGDRFRSFQAFFPGFFAFRCIDSMEQVLILSGASKGWYCARTQPKHEHVAARNLGSPLGLEVFNPRLRIERATRRGLVRLTGPLFPSYVFVRCHLEEHGDHIRYTAGVNSLVHFGQKVPAVPDEVVETQKTGLNLADFASVSKCGALFTLRAGATGAIAMRLWHAMCANIMNHWSEPIQRCH